MSSTILSVFGEHTDGLTDLPLRLVKKAQAEVFAERLRSFLFSRTGRARDGSAQANSGGLVPAELPLR